MSGKPAARVTDPTACPLPGHGTNPIVAGSSNVFFDGLPAARQGDASACGGAMSGGLATTVLINGKPAATVDSVGTHGNKVIAGSGTVIIGNSHTPAPFVAPLPVIIPGIFNRSFAFKTTSGKVVEGLNYSVRSGSGIEKVGTARAGISGIFSTGQKAEPVMIYVSAE
ncbi:MULTISPECIES: PAAR domain-containing protein [Pseudomonas]|uniref:PAAR domain-containing protein n=2 Tax=Pseudomonas fragariae (ex Marin et al. 2024) TaxID=3080056 RepID=A0ABT3LPH0_9PSED|nr:MULTISPECIES: PAAR domain-containing protein [Pseudomonas]MCW6057970.1 PAAR domain-containing protein [Pseudomonas fragi]MDV0428058.1 PAAR domain-containing protein [Pseudomonas sp. 17]MDX9574415.1 PAAR domain-containing protein [Pseudomonas sp. 21(2023)]MDX9588599.1 PAAR domain-containing protein [Pseudomonas sp. 19(2023)]MDX9625524.1 PAAR domain-containing protein [Pseudomonas sp. 20]